ncbi:hypothetical protein JTB14_006094 [Gonioctena quinquepunctata]|nr:hypothetical protein JTB14_006094 [Gonioctena quinquepunctata]
MESMVCPLCGKPLEIKQISFTNAIYLCVDLKCPYPVNQQCFVVERQLDEKNNFISGPSPEKPKTVGYSKPPDPPPYENVGQDGDFDLNAVISNALSNLGSEAVENIPVNNAESIQNNNVRLNNNDNHDATSNPPYVESNHFAELEEIFNGLI